MSGFVEGIDRSPSSLFPAELEDYVADNLVRAVDAFVDGLDLGKLGFGRVAPLEKGTALLSPGDSARGILRSGYLNRVPSSRRLERECQRNIELIWLTGHLAPDFKTIADFRKDNGKAIREVCRSFVAVCRDLRLRPSEASVAIDGSQFKAVNARDKNFTEAKMKRRLERIEESALHGAIGDCRPSWRCGAGGKGCAVQGQNREIFAALFAHRAFCARLILLRAEADRVRLGFV